MKGGVEMGAAEDFMVSQAIATVLFFMQKTLKGDKAKTEKWKGAIQKIRDAANVILES